MEKKKIHFQRIKKYFLSNMFCDKQKVPELRFPEFQSKWISYKLSEIGEIFTGTTPSTKDKNNYSKNGFLWITPGDINYLKYVKNTEKKLSIKGFEKSRKAPSNSIFVTCIGATIGKICINTEECSCNQQLNCIIPHKKFNNDFIYYLISKNEEKLKLYAGNTATPILNKNDFSNLKFYFSSIEEQDKIGDFLSVLDKKIELMENEILKNKQFKKSLLSKMFC